jgi:hypothetical protein
MDSVKKPSRLSNRSPSHANLNGTMLTALNASMNSTMMGEIKPINTTFGVQKRSVTPMLGANTRNEAIKFES